MMFFFSNKLSDSSAKFIGEAFVRLNNLKSISLNLSKNLIGEKGAETLANGIATLENLKNAKFFLYE